MPHRFLNIIVIYLIPTNMLIIKDLRYASPPLIIKNLKTYHNNKRKSYNQILADDVVDNAISIEECNSNSVYNGKMSKNTPKYWPL